MRARFPAVWAMIAMVACCAGARADVVAFSLNGLGFSGSGYITIAPDVAPPDPNPNCGTPGNNPCRTDPAGADMITTITGTFSDATDGISNATITRLLPIDPADEMDATFDQLVPSSLSFIYYAGGHYSYNNLYFPGGSPIDCGDFSFTGTLLDVYGVAFTAGGYTVNVWGDGDLYGPGTTTYGIAVVDGSQALDDQFSGVDVQVPEPGSLASLGTGLLGVLAWRRRSQAPRATAGSRG